MDVTGSSSSGGGGEARVVGDAVRRSPGARLEARVEEEEESEVWRRRLRLGLSLPRSYAKAGRLRDWLLRAEERGGEKRHSKASEEKEAACHVREGHEERRPGTFRRGQVKGGGKEGRVQKAGKQKKRDRTEGRSSKQSKAKQSKQLLSSCARMRRGGRCFAAPPLYDTVIHART